eukprot:12232425-Karenia_brevis.AAC.1
MVPLTRVEEAEYPVCNCKSKNHHALIFTQMRAREITRKLGSDLWTNIYPDVNNRPIAEECIMTP